jgi:hypothetical protein
LSNNSTFLTERVNQELADLANFQKANDYSAQTLQLGRGRNCFVRANMWFPRSGKTDDVEWENSLFAYELPHDHNFSFLTVGHYGPGYATSIYEYDPESVVGYPGEQVAISFLEHTTLPAGKVMFYRASKDIHSQEEPFGFSISLNLMVNSPELAMRNQYWFDLTNGTIKSCIQNAGSARLMVCRMAAYLHNGQTADLLDQISQKYFHPATRGMAYQALATIHAGDSEHIWQKALRDTAPLVRYRAVQALENR